MLVEYFGLYQSHGQTEITISVDLIHKRKSIFVRPHTEKISKSKTEIEKKESNE